MYRQIRQRPDNLFSRTYDFAIKLAANAKDTQNEAVAGDMAD